MEETTPLSAPEVRVLKTATCASTSGKSKLTYEVGCTPDSELHVRITANTGSGAISKNWVAFRAIREVLNGAPPGELTSGHMQKACAGQSANNAGFLLAVLMSEGLVRSSTSKRRAYECADDAAFDAAINAWKSAADGDGEKAPKKRRGKSVTGFTKKQQEQAISAVPPEATQSSALDAPKSRPSDVSQDTPSAAMDSIPSFTAMESPKKAEKKAEKKPAPRQPKR